MVKASVESVRKVIGPVASFKQAVVIDKLPKTRSGKIARNTLKAMINNQPFKVCILFFKLNKIILSSVEIQVSIVVVSLVFKKISTSLIDKLSCYYTNATSLRCKITELEFMASTSKPYYGHDPKLVC